MRSLYRRGKARLHWCWRQVYPLCLRRRLDVVSAAGGLGDELMALGVVQAAASVAKSCRITYHVRHAAIMPEGHEAFRIVRYAPDHIPKHAIHLTYRAKCRLSLVEQMGRQLGLRLRNWPIVLPQRPRSDLPTDFPASGQVVVIQPSASKWTPNKEWPRDSWRHLIELLPEDIEIIEIGTESAFSRPPRHPRFRSFAGRTSVQQFAACIQEADLFVGPPSGGMHFAHAYRVPSVIIVGGYEAPHYPYSLAVQLGSSLRCAPCWLRTPCPYDRRCLREITVEQVRQAVLDQVTLHARRPRATA